MNYHADGLSRPTDGKIEWYFNSEMTPEKALEILKGYEPRWYRDVQLKRNADKSEKDYVVIKQDY